MLCHVLLNVTSQTADCRIRRCVSATAAAPERKCQPEHGNTLTTDLLEVGSSGSEPAVGCVEAAAVALGAD